MISCDNFLKKFFVIRDMIDVKAYDVKFRSVDARTKISDDDDKRACWFEMRLLNKKIERACWFSTRDVWNAWLIDADLCAQAESAKTADVDDSDSER